MTFFSEENFSGEQQIQYSVCLGTIGLIVASWKFDVLKATVQKPALEAILFYYLITSFPRGNYQQQTAGNGH